MCSEKIKVQNTLLLFAKMCQCKTDQFITAEPSACLSVVTNTDSSLQQTAYLKVDIVGVKSR
jgi:hypothetical protein